jgi:hypothetical protein
LPELPKLVIAGIENVMMEDRYSQEHLKGSRKVPEARYSYYRRCQIFRRNGEQCKAPAEKGAHICHAHAGQQTTVFRRDLERRIVLAEAVAEMRRRGRPECQMGDLLTDFKGIQVTLAVMAKALIDGRIDCKTAGRLVVQLQMISKLLWQIHRQEREGRKENQISAQICADERRLSKEEAFIAKVTKEHEEHQTLPLINTGDINQKKPSVEMSWATTLSSGRAHAHGGARILQFEVTAVRDGSLAHGPPKAKAA